MHISVKAVPTAEQRLSKEMANARKTSQNAAMRKHKHTPHPDHMSMSFKSLESTGSFFSKRPYRTLTTVLP